MPRAVERAVPIVIGVCFAILFCSEALAFPAMPDVALGVHAPKHQGNWDVDDFGDGAATCCSTLPSGSRSGRVPNCRFRRYRLAHAV